MAKIANMEKITVSVNPDAFPGSKANKDDVQALLDTLLVGQPENQSKIYNNPQISGIIFDNTPPLIRKPYMDLDTWEWEIMNYQKLFNFLSVLGWIEHTADWDPYLEIHLTTGQIIVTTGGYWDIKLNGHQLIILDEDEDDEQYNHTIETSELQQIILYR